MLQCPKMTLHLLYVLFTCILSTEKPIILFTAMVHSMWLLDTYCYFGCLPWFQVFPKLNHVYFG